MVFRKHVLRLAVLAWAMPCLSFLLRSPKHCPRTTAIRALDLGDIGSGLLEATSAVAHLSMDAAKVTVEGVKVAAPIVAKESVKAYQFVAPMVKEGVDTATPIIREAIREGIDTASPVVNEAIQTKALPAMQSASESATAVIQPYIDQARDIAGDGKVEGVLQAQRATRTGLAASLRSIAGVLEPQVEKAIAPTEPGSHSPLAPLMAPFQAAIQAQEQAALAPIYALQEEIEARIRNLLLLTGGGVLVILVAGKVIEPITRAVQQLLTLFLAFSLAYGTMTYGPTLYSIWSFFHGDTDVDPWALWQASHI